MSPSGGHYSLLFDQGFPNKAGLQRHLADWKAIWQYFVSMILYLAMLFILSIFQNMFQNKFKTGFPMCTSESDTQSPAELRVQYPTMPQLLPQPAAAKNSVLCARRALCFLARFAWRGGMPAPAQLALKARNGGRSASSRCLFFFSFSAKVSFVLRVAPWTTNEKLVKSQQCLLFSRIFCQIVAVLL